MTCERIVLPNGTAAIVYGARRSIGRCGCGRPGTLLCDWKVPNRIRKSPTCDAPICARCTTSPAPDKDLCPRHARDFESCKSRRRP